MNHSLCGQVLRGVEEFLTQHKVSFSLLVINALQDPESPLVGELISKITDILEALRPHLDAGTIIEIGRFFASIASSELSKLGKHKLWHLPATTLSADELEEFSVAEIVEQDVVYQCSLYIYNVANTITRCARPKPYLEYRVEGRV